MRYSPSEQALAEAAGFSVSPDPDQPGLYQWVRREQGTIVEGCDGSFDTAQAAWEAVIADLLETLLFEADLSSEDWDGLSQAQRLAHVQAVYPDA